MIEIKHLNKTFSLKGRSVDAVRDVSLTVQDGDIYGVIGYSGAGKSTLVRCINLLETPDSGSLRVNDSDLITVENGVLKDYSAGHITKEHSRILMEALQEHFGSDKLTLYELSALIFHVEAIVPLLAFFSYRSFCHGE